MAAQLGVSEEAFYATYTRKPRGRQKASSPAVRELKEVKAGKHGWDCIMLDRSSVPGKALCKLYQARPTQCRTWPFWQEVVESAETWDQAANGCPGMNTGTLHSGDDISASASLPYPL